jgi:1-acyl-sn-glycerol-3-phosphate acyltransferase
VRAATSLVRRLTFPYRAPPHPLGVPRLPATRRTGADYDTAWARRHPARLARLAVTEGPMRAVVGALAAPERHGLDRLARLSGPIVFAANHHSHLDAPLVITSIPEPWRHRLVVAAAADYFFANRVTGALSALVMGAFPIERSRVSRRSADDAAALVAEGWSLVIFPEGGRSPDGWGQPFRGGAAYLSARTGAPVVPVHLEGTARILRKGRRLPKPARTRVTFGRPLRPEGSEDARRFSARIEQAVAELADEAASDWWSARRRAVKGATPPLTGPDAPTWRRLWALDRPAGGRARARRRRTWPPL